MSATNTSVRMVDGADPDYRAVLETLARSGDKGTVMVVAALWQRPLRYNGIPRGVQGIPQRMLTLSLKGLEQDGLVERTVFPTVPPRVDYELTGLGRTLIVPLHALYEWARAHRPAMQAARARFAAKSGSGNA